MDTKRDRCLEHTRINSPLKPEVATMEIKKNMSKLVYGYNPKTGKWDIPELEQPGDVHIN